MRYRSLFLGLLVTLIGLTGCKGRYFKDQAAAVQFLNANKVGLEQMAEEWAATRGAEPMSSFCNFGKGRYRWGTAFITNVGGVYDITLDGKEQRTDSLEAAARLSGTTAKDLNHWIELTSRYKTYGIRPSIDGSVQIFLEGSDWAPYGFRYAPVRNARALASLLYYSQHGGVESSDLKMEAIGSRWFYFEARR